MTTNQIMFFIFSAVIVIFSILTVTTRRILRVVTVRMEKMTMTA